MESGMVCRTPGNRARDTGGCAFPCPRSNSCARLAEDCPRRDPPPTHGDCPPPGRHQESPDTPPESVSDVGSFGEYGHEG